jgi:hypothetical protein
MLTGEAGGAGTASATLCGDLSFVCDYVAEQVGGSITGSTMDFANALINLLVATFSKELAEAVTTVLVELTTGWLFVKHTDVQSPFGPVDQLQTHTGILTTSIAVGALLVTATRMMLNRNGRDFRVMVRGLIWLVIVTTTAVPGVALLLEIGDSYSYWIIGASTGGDAEAKLKLLVQNVLALGGAKARFLVIVLLFIMLIGALGQLVVFLGRDVGLVLTTGLAPVAAAGALTARGEHTRRRYFAWGAVFIIYKPGVATVYAGCFWMIANSNGKVVTAVGGITGLVMGAFTMPALLRLITPIMVGGTSVWSGDRSMAGTTKARSVATGALKTVITGRRPSGGGASGGGGGGGGNWLSHLFRLHPHNSPYNTGGGGTFSRVVSSVGTRTTAAAKGAVAAAYIVAVAGTNTVKKIGRTAASGIDEKS